MREHLRSGTEAVDGLRGIAILLVLLYHTWLFSWYTPALRLFGIYLPVDVFPRDGYLGVDLFFTISGFVLFFPHAVTVLSGGRLPGTGDYAFRRFIKIVPSYALALLVTAAVSLEFLSWPEMLKSLSTHVFFVQNAFDDEFGRANSVFWSLAIEVQFYLIFPLVARAFRRAPIPTATAMFATALLYRSLAAHCCLEYERIMRQLPAYLDLFAAGMLAAYLVVWIRTRRPRLATWPLVFTLATVASAYGAFALMQSADTIQYVVLGPPRWDIVNRSLIALTGGALVLCSCLANRWFRRLLGNPILTFLSIISYNVYLWHTVILIWMWKHGVPRAATPNPHDDNHWKAIYIATGWLAVFVVSIAITYFVERPLLGSIKPQTFAFAWRARFTPASRGAASGTRT